MKQQPLGQSFDSYTAKDLENHERYRQKWIDSPFTLELQLMRTTLRAKDTFLKDLSHTTLYMKPSRMKESLHQKQEFLFPKNNS